MKAAGVSTKRCRAYFSDCSNVLAQQLIATALPISESTTLDLWFGGIHMFPESIRENTIRRLKKANEKGDSSIYAALMDVLAL